MIEITNLSREFKQRNREIFAVDDVNLKIQEGSFINITGHSGSGKSTLLNLIAGLLKPTGGEVLINGTDISKLSDKEAALMRNRTIGYVMQGNAALSNLTVLENVCLPFYLYVRDENVSKRAEELLERVGIGSLKDAYPSQFREEN